LVFLLGRLFDINVGLSLLLAFVLEVSYTTP
jgi:hypothetical protein